MEESRCHAKERDKLGKKRQDANNNANERKGNDTNVLTRLLLSISKTIHVEKRCNRMRAWG